MTETTNILVAATRQMARASAGGVHQTDSAGVYRVVDILVVLGRAHSAGGGCEPVVVVDHVLGPLVLVQLGLNRLSRYAMDGNG